MDAIIGYVEPFVAEPATTIEVKVSCSRSTYTSSLLRLGPGVAIDNGPPVKHTAILSVPRAKHTGRSQYSSVGSFAYIPNWNANLAYSGSVLKASVWAFPTLLPASHDQYLFSNLDRENHCGFACFLDTQGMLAVVVGNQNTEEILISDIQLETGHWYRIESELLPASGAITLRAKSKQNSPGSNPTTQTFSAILNKTLAVSSSCGLVVAAAEHQTGASPIPKPSTCFNGRIDNLIFWKVDGESTVETLHLDFSIGINTATVTDVSRNGLTGFLLNAPTRAVPGHDWDGSEGDWTKAKFGYGAIHFHDDDLDDAAWDTDFSISLPENLPSGPYAIFVDDGETNDYITFFVSPKLSINKVAVVLSTFTYLAYANERLYDTSRAAHIAVPGSDSIYQGEHWQNIKSRTDIGISLYDSHSDNSGAVFSSEKRPLLNVRPNYIHWGFNGPRELSADLMFLPFLDQVLGVDQYDVITDHYISAKGLSALDQYSIVISNSHPEYPTFAMLDTYSKFLDRGGFFMYLGGNGYYWVTSHDANSPHRIEVRRGGQGCRSFELPAGELIHSNTGEAGGLWRSRGRPSNKLFGLGSAACGMGDGAAYGIVPEARKDPKVAFVFADLGIDEKIVGDFGLINNAASGDEIDRLDFGLGTPAQAVLLATTKLAGGHSDNYGVFNEEVMFPMINTMGTTCDKVRSDLIYYETESGGAVFSVGSINWVGSLAWRNYSNNIATITRNVLCEFVSRMNRRNLP